MSYYPSVIKSVQRGVYAGAGGNVAITAVNITKTMVLSASKSSAGTVAATGNVTGTLTASGGSTTHTQSASSQLPSQNVTLTWPNYTSACAISGGSTSLTVRVYSARLVDATTINCDGPVEWQVIEYA